MSDILTSITLPGCPKGWGYQDWGRQSVPAMIAMVRLQAANLRRQAEAIERAADEDFRVTIVRGSHVQHHVKTLQEGKLP